MRPSVAIEPDRPGDVYRNIAFEMKMAPRDHRGAIVLACEHQAIRTSA
jgi:hypothetical protein